MPELTEFFVTFVVVFAKFRILMFEFATQLIIRTEFIIVVIMTKSNNPF